MEMLMVVLLLERVGGTMVFSRAAAFGTSACPRWHGDLACHVSKNGKNVVHLLFSVTKMARM
jgi:hypothetical protein